MRKDEDEDKREEKEDKRKMRQEKEEQQEKQGQGHLVRGGDLGDGRVRERAVLHRAPRLVGDIVRLVEGDGGVARAALRVLTADRKVALRKADTARGKSQPQTMATRGAAPDGGGWVTGVMAARSTAKTKCRRGAARGRNAPG